MTESTLHVHLLRRRAVLLLDVDGDETAIMNAPNKAYARGDGQYVCPRDRNFKMYVYFPIAIRENI